MSEYTVTEKHRECASFIIEKHFTEYSGNRHVLAHLIETIATHFPETEPVAWKIENDIGEFICITSHADIAETARKGRNQVTPLYTK